MNDKTSAIILAAGNGRRMNSKVKKQYLLLRGKPVLYYSLKAFEDSFIDEIILVVGEGEEEYVRREIIGRYGFRKVTMIVQGGAERYISVHNGLQAVSEDSRYCFIHDGARPFLDRDILKRVFEGARVHFACAAGMPVKDTIKLADEYEFVESTPRRDRVWMIQTPQAFTTSLIRLAYDTFMQKKENISAQGIQITDDAMVVETLGMPVKLVYGSYENIKITTPEDLVTAESFLK